MGDSRTVTIFEGPDGGGKTTLAKDYATLTRARYVHFGPLPQVTTGLARLYVEGLLPALLGYEHVVLDRCWLSELPYATAFRQGQDRLTTADRRMLARVALRCGAVVVRCLPPWPVVRKNYLTRKKLELLENDRQLKQVYGLYQHTPTDLPTLDYDYTQENHLDVLVTHVDSRRHACHPLHLATAGAWDAPTVLVGEKFDALKNQDPLYRWPFASFTATGCSRWLTNQLEALGKPEAELFWVNADQDLSRLKLTGRNVYALGEQAAAALTQVGSKFIRLPHPQYWKAFQASSPYPLNLKDNP